MRVRFHIPAPLRSFTQGSGEVELDVPAATLADALSALWAAYPALRDRVVTEQGQIREHINIFVGKEHVRYTGGLATRIDSESEISIVPALSGGGGATQSEPFSNLRGQKYLSLASFRKDGQAVRTPLWFAEADGKLFLMTRDDSWKYKRMRNNARVLVAPCTIRGRITGADTEGRARILAREEFPAALQRLKRKYWLMRLPVWSKRNIFIEITAA